MRYFYEINHILILDVRRTWCSTAYKYANVDNCFNINRHMTSQHMLKVFKPTSEVLQIFLSAELKQLDNLQSLSTSDSQLGSGSLTISAHTHVTHTSCVIVNMNITIIPCTVLLIWSKNYLCLISQPSTRQFALIIVLLPDQSVWYSPCVSNQYDDIVY